jgi:multidrug efflux pump subunit AcrA (membrane-fusion protein)
LALNQFEKAATESKLRDMWRDAVRHGDIAGAYWATLTHPLTNQTIISEAFGEVHMLSHLVGAANRADIRRLAQLETERSELQTKLERQQQALHAAVVARDRQIQALREALTARIIAGPTSPEDAGALRGLVSDLERRLAAETRRRSALEERLGVVRTDRDKQRTARMAAEQVCDALRVELDTVEASLLPPEDASAKPIVCLDGIVLLYVGGRPNQIAHMRAMVERSGAVFLHHDGGVENHPTLLAGLTSRSHLVVFPVDCISHDAANAVKALCRQRGKRFIALRSASVTSLLAALQTAEVIALPATC